MQYTISGIDVSRHNGTIDFAKVAASGQRFAIVKATEGVDYVDPKFVENWRKLRDLDGELYRGAYHFARPDSVGGELDGAAEARDFCRALKAGGGYMQGCLPPALDFEKYSDSDSKSNVPWIRAFVRTVEDELGRQPMIYTGANIWAAELGNSDEFVDIPLWLVNYSREAEPPRLAKLPWPTFALWQWSGGGDFAYGPRVPGVDTTVDLNWFNGSEAELAVFALLDSQANPKPDLAGIQSMLAAVQGQLVQALEMLAAVNELIEDSAA